MRLTLRTLLSWVDGVLTPEEQRFISESVAGSKVATRLAERIREGACCGSTDALRAGGPTLAGDPNRVAEYLDNRLLSDHLEAFERLCIESRPHLAEVATCHGILAEMYRNPRLARMPREQRSLLGQRLRRSVKTAAVSSNVAPAPRSESMSRETVPAEKPAAASPGPADARAAADALVQAMLSTPSRPLEPERRSDGWQRDPVAAMVSLLPSWPRSIAASPESDVSPAAASRPGKAARLPAWTAWVTAGLALAALLVAGGALTSPFRGPKTYKPEPGCMHCTKP